MAPYREQLQRWMAKDDQINEFIHVRDDRVIFGAALDLLALAQQYGTPLEISFCPLITRRIKHMQAAFATARERAGYRGEFVYAYATKANFAEEVVRTAIGAGANYETSSAFDVRIAHQLWQRGLLPPERFIFCNGSKEPAYINAILDLRQAGHERIVPILDDPDEFEALAGCPLPLLLGVRERKDAGDLAEGITYGYDRFGMTPAELGALARRVTGTPHQIILYHAMTGSQLEDQSFWLREVLESLATYADLRAELPTLAYFNFGGGMPTAAYDLSFRFDYAAFAERLQREIAAWCDARGLAHPHLVGEFGRYSVADHGVHIFSVGKIKAGLPGQPPWYLVNGSLMVALPDILIVKGQHFITLALNYFDAEAGPVVLGGRRTCDSDDFYPRGDVDLIMPLVSLQDKETRRQGDKESMAEPISLSPHLPVSPPLLIAFFGTGAYQSMLAGEGGAHHCLAPEAPKLIVEELDGRLSTRAVGEQTWEDVLGELGYL